MRRVSITEIREAAALHGPAVKLPNDIPDEILMCRVTISEIKIDWYE
jgi:hypothetical protein